VRIGYAELPLRGYLKHRHPTTPNIKWRTVLLRLIIDRKGHYSGLCYLLFIQLLECANLQIQSYTHESNSVNGNDLLTPEKKAVFCSLWRALVNMVLNLQVP
jgi:hypothetical protein